jgi:hypothetical protein
VVAVAARDAEWAQWAEERGFSDTMGQYRHFSTLGEAVRTYRDTDGAPPLPAAKA